jgi:NitT/TauT family transport system ATP-binding protein
MALINATAISKVFPGNKGEQFEALRDINLAVEEGEFVVLIGPSGCGKTTLLRIMGQLEQPTAGTMQMVKPPGSTSTGAKPGRSGIGFVFQDATLMPWRSALKNVELPLEMYGIDAKRRRAMAVEMLELVGLHGVERKLPAQLSGGMRQRVSIARALVHDPAVLLMDEPFGALDAQTRDTMNVELQRIWLQNRKTVVFVTHSVPEAIFLADRIVLLASHPGRIHSISQVDLPRPRTMEMMETETFRSLARDLRDEIGRVRGDISPASSLVAKEV